MTFKPTSRRIDRLQTI